MKNFVFIDRDIFLFFFEPEDEENHKLIKDFFTQVIEGKIKAYTTTHVILSLAEALESTGRWKKEEIARNIQLILLTPNLKVNYREILEDALVTYLNEKDISFQDAYHLEIMKKMKATAYASLSNKFKNHKNMIGVKKK